LHLGDSRLQCGFSPRVCGTVVICI
jgi:hypothetical protein